MAFLDNLPNVAGGQAPTSQPERPLGKFLSGINDAQLTQKPTPPPPPPPPEPSFFQKAENGVSSFFKAIPDIFTQRINDVKSFVNPQMTSPLATPTAEAAGPTPDQLLKLQENQQLIKNPPKIAVADTISQAPEATDWEKVKQGVQNLFEPITNTISGTTPRERANIKIARTMHVETPETQAITTAKVPFVNEEIVVKKFPVVTDTLGWLIESPERIFNDIRDSYKGVPERNPGQLTADSFIRQAQDFHDNAVAQGVDEKTAITTAIIYGVAQGLFDVALVGGLLEKGAKGLLKGDEKNVAQQTAWETLGKPENLDEAKLNYNKLAHDFHPDKPGGSTDIMAQINNSWETLQQYGVPKTTTPAKEMLKDLARKYLDTIGSEYPQVAKSLSETTTPMKQLTSGENIPGEQVFNSQKLEHTKADIAQAVQDNKALVDKINSLVIPEGIKNGDDLGAFYREQLNPDALKGITITPAQSNALNNSINANINQFNNIAKNAADFPGYFKPTSNVVYHGAGEGGWAFKGQNMDTLGDAYYVTDNKDVANALGGKDLTEHSLDLSKLKPGELVTIQDDAALNAFRSKAVEATGIPDIQKAVPEYARQQGIKVIDARPAGSDIGIAVFDKSVLGTPTPTVTPTAPIIAPKTETAITPTTTAPKTAIVPIKIDPNVLSKLNENLQFYQTNGGMGVGKEVPNAGLQKVDEILNTPEGKTIGEQSVQKAVDAGEIKPDANGEVEVYRTGEPTSVNNLNSATTSKEVAQQFSDLNKGAPIYTFKVTPSEISYYIGGPEKELLIKNEIISQKITNNNGPKTIGIADESALYTPRMRKLITEAQKNDEIFPYTKMTKEEQAIVDKVLNDKVSQIPMTIPEGYRPYIRTITGDTVDIKQLKNADYFRAAYESTFAQGGPTDEKLYKILKKELVPEGKEPSGFLADLYNKAENQFVQNNEVPVDKLKANAQAGFVDPGAALADAKKAIQDAKDYIELSNRVNEFTGDLDKDLNIIRTSAKADSIMAKELLRKADIKPADAEAIYHYAEDKGYPITEEQKAQYDKYIKPLQQERDKLFADLKNEGVPIEKENYTPRFVANKGGVFERLKEGGKSIREGGILRKTTGSFKHRVMRALVNDAGERKVVAIKKGQVTEFDNKVAKDLGKLKIKKYQDLLDNEITPLQNKLEALQKEASTLSSVKTRSPISQARLESLHNKIVELHVESAVKSLLEGEKNAFNTREKASLMRTITEIKALEKVKPSDSVVLTKQRINGLNKKVVELVNQIADVEGKYPENLNAKVFIDNSGRKWKIVDATTREIEKNTNITYHKNILLNELISYTRLKQVARANEFLTSIKESPQFSEFSMKVGEGNTPKGWKPTTLPQFIGYNFDPKIADALDNFAKNVNKGNVLLPLNAINSFLRTSIFFNPFIHMPNIMVHGLVARGTARFFIPKSYLNVYKSSTRAFMDILTMNKDYQEMLRSGVNLLYSDTTSQLTDMMLKKMGEEIVKDPQLELVSKALQIPKKTIQTIWGRNGVSSKMTWFTNDFFTLQAIYEREAEGMSREQAIRDVAKHIPNYQVPSRILNSRMISQVMQNSNLTMFGAYHYGALKSYGEMIKTLIGGDAGELGVTRFSGKANKARAGALDQMVMMAIAGLFLYPQMDKILQSLTGNKKARFRRAGALTFPENLYDVIKGKEDFSTFLQSIMTPAVGTKAIIQLAFNRDLFTGQRLINQGNELEDLLNFSQKQIAPVSQAQQLMTGAKDPGDFLLGLIGVSTPNTTPSVSNINNLLYDRRNAIMKEVKDLYSQGKEAEANQEMAKFNKMLLQNYIDAFKENGYPITDEEALRNWLIQFLAQGKFILPPTTKQLQNFQNNQQLNPFQKILK